MIENLAAAGLCGLSVSHLIRANPLERELLLRVTRRAAEVAVQLQKNQAVYIANAVNGRRG